MSAGFLLFLMTMVFSGYAIQYYIATLYIGNLPGDKFVNGMIFGVSEILSVLISGILMSNFSDMTVFNIIFIESLVAYFIYIFFGDVGNICYLGIVLLVQALGGWQNLYFLIAELRVPPENLGSVNMVAINMALALGIFTPYLVILPGVIPLVVSCIVSVICWCSCFCLPAPGSNLPKTTADKEGKKTIDRTVANVNESIGNAFLSLMAPVSHYTLHQFSF